MNREAVVAMIRSWQKDQENSVLTEKDAYSIVLKLAKSFSFDLSKQGIWADSIWEELFPYNDNHDWEKLLVSLLGPFAENVYVAISDNEFFPWPVLICNKKSLVAFLNSQPYFEFFVFDTRMKKVLFDAHHNELILISNV